MSITYHREMLLVYLLSLSFYFALFKKNKSKAILSGMSLGSSLLAKMTALFLFIPIIYQKYKDSNQKQLLTIFSLATILITPVIFYNIASYLKFGYADVFFSNIFGVYRPGSTPRNSLNIIRSTTSSLSYLADLYSPLVFVFSCAALLFSIKDKKSHSLIIWLVTAFSFISVTAIRSYYFFILFVPLVTLSANLIAKFKSSTAQKLLFLSLVLYSSSYTLNTFHFRSNYLPPNTFDGPEMIPVSINQTAALTPNEWTRSFGFKQTVKFLEEQKNSDFCVEYHSGINDLATRRYFWINDQIKSHYLGDYPPRFPLCTGEETVQFIIFQEQSGLVNIEKNTIENFKP